MHNLNNEIKINMINLDNKISMSINLFFIKMKLIVYNINLSNLIDYIINMIIVNFFFMIDKMIIKRFKKHINYITMNMLIEKDIHFFFINFFLKLIANHRFLK